MSQTLSVEAIRRARQFVEENARSLDRSFLEHALWANGRDDAATRVVRELESFQTADGGFAHGIEPDIRTSASTCVGTSVAFQYLRAVVAPATLPIVRAAIDYLVRTVDRAAWVWPAVDEQVLEGPHAPWWAPNLDRFHGYVFNPSAELLGYLYDYRELVPNDVIEGVTTMLLRTLDQGDVIESPYELACGMRLAQSEGLPRRLRTPLEDTLSVSLEAADLRDPHLNLIRIVPTPSSFGADIVRDGIRTQAARLIETQADDGGWHPTWEPWNADAHREWRGEITSHYLAGLQAHGFIAGSAED